MQPSCYPNTWKISGCQYLPWRWSNAVSVKVDLILHFILFNFVSSALAAIKQPILLFVPRVFMSKNRYVVDTKTDRPNYLQQLVQEYTVSTDLGIAFKLENK